MVGRLAAIPPPTSPEESRILNGVLVQNDFKLSLMAPEDLREYAALTTTTIHCKQRLTLAAAGIDLIKWALEGTFGAIETLGPATSDPKPSTNGSTTPQDMDADGEIERPKETTTSFLIMGCVIVRHQSPGGEVTVEWEGNMLNDGIADAVLAVLFSVESSPAAVKQSASTNGHHHHHHHHLEQRNPHADASPEERFERLCMFLEAQFGSQITPIANPKLNLLKPEGKKGGEESGGVKMEVEEGEEMTDEERAELEARELQRLHELGVPVPGVEVRVDKFVARVWLEDLEVECANAVFRDRVKAVVERSVEVVSPMWKGR